MEERRPSSEQRDDLKELQSWFQSVITHPGGVLAGAAAAAAANTCTTTPIDVADVVTASRSLNAQDRLSVYANAYYARLLDCLGEIYPMLKQAVSPDHFIGFAFAYLQSYPSRSYTLNELGRHFPSFLAETRPSPATERERTTLAADWPDFLVDLARLEWTIYEVFDGPGVEGESTLRSDDLLALTPERWENARLHPVPCLRLLSMRFPVNRYFTLLRENETPPPPLPKAAQTFVALSRRDFVVRRYELAKREFQLLKALCDGRCVGEAIEEVVSSSAPEGGLTAEDLQGWFQRWTAEGFFKSAAIE